MYINELIASFKSVLAKPTKVSIKANPNTKYKTHERTNAVYQPMYVPFQHPHAHSHSATFTNSKPTW